ncbi:MAG: hypothetical protein IJT97_00095 [Bacteroidaceae bacterium]|nr:hypothetical protein [Bacteroidaceae bacterium]
MKRQHISLILFAAVLATACTDKLFDEIQSNPLNNDTDGMVFSLNVQEQCDLMYESGNTRATKSDTATTLSEDPTFGPRFFSGDNMGLKLYALQLPFVGIHPKTVAAGLSAETRASVDAIIPAGNNTLTFHDSLTVWGYTDKGRTLFNQILMKKVVGWRSSVHWPYDRIGVPEEQKNPQYMRFYAVSPSMESLEDMQVIASPNYNSPPVFSYKIPNDPAQQRDLLYGESGDIDIQAGPPSGVGRYENTTESEKEQHLGDDDKTVTLNFKHLLTTVRFAQGRIPAGAHITSVALYNIKNEGTYYPMAEDNVVLPMLGLGDTGLGNWVTTESTTGTYVIDTDFTSEQYTPGNQAPTTSPLNHENVYQTAGNENVYITDKVLFVMPHIVTTAAELQVTIDMGDGKGDRKLKASLLGCYWKKGYTITYYITIGEIKGDYYLLVEPSATETGTISAPKAGETGTELKGSQSTNATEHSTTITHGAFTIHSYQNYKDYSVGESAGINVHNRTAWRVNGFSFTGEADTYNAANRPAWLESITGWTSPGSEGVSEGAKTPDNVTGDNQTISYSLKAQSYAYTTNHATVLDNNLNVSNLDLSRYYPNGSSSAASPMADGSPYNNGLPYNTANSYIVNAEGTYKFPLVYGNAIQNGLVVVDNPSDIFVDHLGKAIANADIRQQVYSYPEISLSATQKREFGYGGTVTKRNGSSVNFDDDFTAEIIWQDANGVFSYDGFSMPASGYGYFSFRVAGTGVIKPANCVIALKGKKRTRTLNYVENTDTHEWEWKVLSDEDDWTKSSGYDILWTWHIWLTDEVYPNSEQKVPSTGLVYDETLKQNLRRPFDEVYPSYYNGGKLATLANNNKTILPVNLGWVPDNLTFGLYLPREIWVEIEQLGKDNATSTGNKVHLKIRQEAIPELITGTSTVYQWGRPTALPMKTKLDGTSRTIYNAASADITSSFSAAAITSAAEAIGNPTKMAIDWSPATANLWNFDTGNKTLYDPSPVGFQMPAGSVFSVFSLTGADGNGNVLNMRTAEGASSKGGYFYTQDHSESGLIDANRYDPKVYMPATGAWRDDYTLQSTNFGQYWTSEPASGSGEDDLKKAKSMQIWPIKEESGFIKFGAETIEKEYALPVRPMQTP